MSLSSEVDTFQFRVYLRKVSPIIWRRILVRSDSTIADLHHTLQIVMGWDDYHLHEFLIRSKRYGITQIGDFGFMDDAYQVRLDRFRFRPGESSSIPITTMTIGSLRSAWRTTCPLMFRNAIPFALRVSERRRSMMTADPGVSWNSGRNTRFGGLANGCWK